MNVGKLVVRNWQQGSLSGPGRQGPCVVLELVSVYIRVCVQRGMYYIPKYVIICIYIHSPV